MDLEPAARKVARPVSRQRGWLRLTVHTVCCFWLCLALPASGALAEPTTAASGNTPRYAELIHTALSEMEAGNFAEARALLLKAHGMNPNARTLRGLGYVEFELRRYTQSVRYLRAALADKKRPLQAAMKQEVELMLERAEGYTGRFGLALDPASAALSLDGRPADREADGSLWLDVGSHELQLTAAGCEPQHQRLTVIGGERTTLNFTLQRSQLTAADKRAGEAMAPRSVQATRAAPAQATAPVRPAADNGGILTRWWFWTALGVVVVGSAAVGITLAASQTENQAPLDGNLGVTRAVLVVRP